MGLAVEAGVSAPNGSAEGAPADVEWGLSGGGLPAGRAGVSQAEAAAVPPGPVEVGGALPSTFPAAHGFLSPDGKGCPVPAPAQLPCVTRARSDTQGFIVTVTRGPGPQLFLSILV